MSNQWQHNSDNTRPSTQLNTALCRHANPEPKM